MTTIVLLFVVGALLLAAEVFLPGAIAGIIGGCALLLGSILAFVDYGSGIGSLATIGALALLGLMVYAEVVWLPRSRFGRGLVVEATISGQSQPPPASADVIGQTAIALTTLAPTGMIEVAGKRYEGFCRSGMVARGTTLKVIGLDNFRLIVSENKTP
jgi:membrane-bound ClpP family serine protease